MGFKTKFRPANPSTPSVMNVRSQGNRQESHSSWHCVGTILKMFCSRVAGEEPCPGPFSGDLGTDCPGGGGSLLSNLKEGGALL
ncbi:hypothetical protein E2320_000559 [Naja naja]|nr:hypothetical protein E2320_000559 [Naja naja]